ncbi:MAG: two-component regulator propeller domain-containing protein [Pedobacter sp.]|uniref:ligand-binding sensor domain-containing protein n=1 Tax=Pedobacter sp. TaxID=1411316 RepID=UPI00280668F4|nr:two-component regulator propeller domain-containing protein [Pedobacter sp.]MDQ8006552.1 two-component regulator propeller domain-containing protein [Pedobacter sp.]
MLTRQLCVFIFILALPKFLWSQNYNFTNYNLKEGLPQSQVSNIYQAKDRTLWLGSFGGVSNFDGLTFKSYTKADGLLSNNVGCITEDSRGQVWVGTDNGINLIHHGKVKKVVEGVDVYNLQTDLQGNIWGLSNRKLFKLQQNEIVFIDVVEGEAITCLNKDKKGNLYIFVRRVGVFKLDKKKWLPHAVFPANVANNNVVKVLFDNNDADKFYLATAKNGIFVSTNGNVNPLFYKPNVEGYFDIAQDADGSIWVATQKGAYLIKNGQQPIVFNEQNGLKTNRVNVITRDVENNIWLSSFGDGVFKYEGDAFVKYDRFKGRDLAYPVSGIALDKQRKLWISTFNKGLYRFDGETITQPEAAKIKDKHLYFVTADRDSNILLSIQNEGLWKYNGTTFAQMPFTKGTNIGAVAQDDARNFYLGEINAVTYVSKNRIEKIVGFKGWMSCLFYHGKDSVLLGTSSGVYLIKNQKIDHQFKINELENAYVTGVVKNNHLLFFCTIGDGLVSFDTRTKAVKRYLTADGLSSNDIYSATFDQSGTLWLGTGRGINKLKYDAVSQRYQIIKGNSPVVEANQNAILSFNNNILVGTTTGVILCNTRLLREKQFAPAISIKGIQIVDRKTNDKRIALNSSLEKLPAINLKHTQNHITINYKGISLTNPQYVLYRYYLLGLDRDFGEQVSTTQAEYSALPPGNYTFKVYAEVNGEKSRTVSFSFTINPPFYATPWFGVLALVVIVLLIWLTMYIILKRKELARKQREAIKLEEQAKIRKQTAEDFHDDIGNKLTRINVLSEILDKKIDGQQEDQKELIRLIKENAGFLYTGTKDVLWALDPQSDNVYEIMQHVRNFGVDLFQHTQITFQMDGFDEKYKKWKMSMEQNRNLTLIAKEILTNILKHAGAKNVNISVFEENQTLKIEVVDDGKGFEMDTAGNGRGLQNIKNRSQRIQANLDMISKVGEGTKVSISNIKPIRI